MLPNDGPFPPGRAIGLLMPGAPMLGRPPPDGNEGRLRLPAPPPMPPRDGRPAFPMFGRPALPMFGREPPGRPPPTFPKDGRFPPGRDIPGPPAKPPPGRPPLKPPGRDIPDPPIPPG